DDGAVHRDADEGAVRVPADEDGAGLPREDATVARDLVELLVAGERCALGELFVLLGAALVVLLELASPVGVVMTTIPLGHRLTITGWPTGRVRMAIGERRNGERRNGREARGGSVRRRE